MGLNSMVRPPLTSHLPTTLILLDPPARGPSFPNKKLIKSPFNMNFDDTPSNPTFQRGGNNPYSNPANEFQPSMHQHGAAPNPFASHQEDELTGNISLSDQPRPLIAKKLPANSFFIPSSQSTASPTTFNPASANYELDENNDPPLLVGNTIQRILRVT